MSHLKIGDLAPAFKGLIAEDQYLQLEDFKGQKIILYFYPKDDTSGCTAQACNLRDHQPALIEQGYQVIGVSPDPLKKHVKFTEKYSLNFPLIADESKEIATAYGVWQEKKFMGKTYMGVVRTTFIIDEEGIIENIISKVDTKAHAEQILPNT